MERPLLAELAPRVKLPAQLLERLEERHQLEASERTPLDADPVEYVEPLRP